MGIENNLCFVDIDLIIMENIDDVHQSHWVYGSIEFVHNKCTAIFQNIYHQRKLIYKSYRAV